MIRRIIFTILCVLQFVSGYDLLSQTEKMDFYIVFLSAKPGRAEISKDSSMKLQEAHLANIGKLAAEDKIIVAGPFEGGGGLFFMKAGSKEQAQSWVDTDPAVQAGRFEILVSKIEVNTGSICKASEPYQMKSFTYILFEPEPVKRESEKSKSDDLFIQNVIDDLNKDYKCLLQIDMPRNMGRIAFYATDNIMKINEFLTEKYKPISQYNTFIIKKFYTAEGSFCEKK